MFNLPNLFTAGNLLSGCLAIILALTGRVDSAPFAVFAGMIFDFLDGFAARFFRSSSELGKQLDSLSDMVTFGVAPGIIMLVYLTLEPGMFHQQAIVNATDFSLWMGQLFAVEQTNLLPLIALFFPVFALFRLAKFNLDTRQSESFIGLPTPAATLFFMSFPLALYFPDHWMNSTVFSEVLCHPITIAVLLVLISILMVTELPLFSLKFKSFGWSGNALRYTFLLISLGLIPLLGVWSFSIIVFLYLLFSIIQNTFSKSKKHEIQSGN